MPIGERKYVLEREEDRNKERPREKEEPSYVSTESKGYVVAREETKADEETKPDAKEYLLENVETPVKAEIHLEEKTETVSHKTNVEDLYHEWLVQATVKSWEDFGVRRSEASERKRSEEHAKKSKEKKEVEVVQK